MTKVYLGLGSNIGDSQATIQQAYERLRALPETHLLATSHFYQTKAWGLEDQADFINSVCLLETELAPLDLLQTCQTIERDLGRERLIHWGPRTLDIDILLYGDLVQDDPQLTLPHPYMTERAFVLVPLLEIAPALTSPVSRDPYQKSCQKLDSSTVKRL